MTTYTAHRDTYARDHLPPRDQWPEFINLDEFGYPARLNCAAALLDRAVDDGDGDRICLQTDERTWTYRALQDCANRIARVLTGELDMVPGERVLLRGPNNAMMAACWFGIVKAGGIVVATMPLLRARELSVIIDKARIRLALCDERLTGELARAQQDTSTVERVLHFNGSGQLEAMLAAQPPGFEAVDTAADDVCLIAFTSGTTGTPKGTMHFHRDVLAICDSFPRHTLKPQRDDIFIGSPPLAFTFGLGGLLLFPMWARAATVLLENVAPHALAEAISRFHATTLFTSPTAYRAIMTDLDQFDLASLRQCISAGETLPRPTFDDWFARTGIRIIDGLGSTELLHIFIAAAGDDIRPGATGRPIPGYAAKVIDADGNELPPGEIGHLAVRGPTGCRYLADERQRVYVKNGWNLTGDAYKIDADGYFWFQARTDDMILSAGYNIAGAEVEAALLEHPLVTECAVVGIPDPQRGHIVKAFVVLHPDTPADAAMVKTLQAHVKQAIAPYKYPRAIEFVNTLPHTETGKLQRFKLREKE